MSHFTPPVRGRCSSGATGSCRFNGEIFPEKPPLMFWTMIAGYKVFGVNELGARFGSAAMALLTALATYHLGRRLFTAEVGLWAGLILPATFIFTVSARAATVDSALTLATLLAILCFAFVRSTGFSRESAERPPKGGTTNGAFPTAYSREPTPGLPDYVPRSWISWVGVYACLGVAVLAKGPIGLLLPAAGIGLFLMVMNHLHRRPTEPRSGKLGRWVDGLVWCARSVSPVNFFRSLWQMRPLTGIAVTAAVALPWFVLVDQRTHGVWITQFLAEFNLRPFTQVFSGHRGPFWYHVPAILIGFFPWSVFMGPTIIDWTRRIRRAHPWRPGYLLLACWSAVFFIFWSICKTKLPHYLLPIYPALALATAAFVHHWLAEPAILGRKDVWIAWGITILAGFLGLAGFPFAARLYVPGEELLGMVGLILVAGGGLSLWLVQRGRRKAGMAMFAAMSLVLITVCFGFVALRIDRHQNARALIARSTPTARASRRWRFTVSCRRAASIMPAGRWRTTNMPTTCIDSWERRGVMSWPTTRTRRTSCSDFPASSACWPGSRSSYARGTSWSSCIPAPLPSKRPDSG